MTMTEVVEAEAQLAEELSSYAGEWVGVRNHKVIASAASLRELAERLSGEDVDSVFQVAEAGAVCYY